jgi:hypothetical protein
MDMIGLGLTNKERRSCAMMIQGGNFLRGKIGQIRLILALGVHIGGRVIKGFGC